MFQILVVEDDRDLNRTVCSYLLSYKRSVLIADQQEYVVTIGVLIANTLNYSYF